MLRILENNEDVYMQLTKYDTYSVDTEADLFKVNKVMEMDVHMSKYIIHI